MKVESRISKAFVIGAAAVALLVGGCSGKPAPSASAPSPTMPVPSAGTNNWQASNEATGFVCEADEKDWVASGTVTNTGKAKAQYSLEVVATHANGDRVGHLRWIGTLAPGATYVLDKRHFGSKPAKDGKCAVTLLTRPA